MIIMGSAIHSRFKIIGKSMAASGSCHTAMTDTRVDAKIKKANSQRKILRFYTQEIDM